MKKDFIRSKSDVICRTINSHNYLKTSSSANSSWANCGGNGGKEGYLLLGASTCHFQQIGVLILHSAKHRYAMPLCFYFLSKIYAKYLSPKLHRAYYDAGLTEDARWRSDCKTQTKSPVDWST